MKFEITKDLPIIEITERYPHLAEYLMDELNFHCIDCPLAYMETLEDGMMVHGLDEAEQETLIRKLNGMIEPN